MFCLQDALLEGRFAYRAFLFLDPRSWVLSSLAFLLLVFSFLVFSFLGQSAAARLILACIGLRVAGLGVRECFVERVRAGS